MKHRLILSAAAIFGLLFSPNPAMADGPGAIGNFGPTGIELDVRRDGTIQVTGIQDGSPAHGLIQPGETIRTIQGQEMPDHLWDQLTTLGHIITEAEAGDGVIRIVAVDEGGEAREIPLEIPVLGEFSPTAPIDCKKSAAIIRNNAAYLRGLASDEAGIRQLARHSHLTALPILSLLSTGQDEDLAVVRAIYAERMRGFNETNTGPHSWNNGYQGIAVCEYFLRTGDASVMPLINAICESARKFQVNGGWTHWATGVNPQYVGGGLLNAAGTNLLTTLLLAKKCGADVDEDTLHSALRFYYRFVGHGINSYGDHRPESGYGGNNGKTELLAAAMHIASHAENGEVYAMARDKAVAGTLYGYRSILGGHTGPIGAMWHAPMAIHLAEKEPELFRIRDAQTRWFHELSRRHDGAFVKSACARYNNVEYGAFLLAGFTAPMRNLQITGAPRSPHAVSFTLPERPWGREGDLAFFCLKGGPDYQEHRERVDPHVEMQNIGKAGKAELAIYAQHPEHVFREIVARQIRDGGHLDLIEELLESPSPHARHTGCMAINLFQPWRVTPSPGWISLQAIRPDDFTPRMFDALIGIVRDAESPLWLVDQAMIAMALADTSQTMAHLDALIPWLSQRDEWWLQESASIALSPALRDPAGLDRILPEMIEAVATSPHTKWQGYVQWMLATRTANQVSEEMKAQIADALKTIYIETPAPPAPAREGDMDLIGISSSHLESSMNWALTVDPTLAAELARLSVDRLDTHMRLREINRTATQLINTAKRLDEPKRKSVAAVLNDHYKRHIIEENRDALSRGAAGNPRHFAGPLQMILDIRALAGDEGGWELIPSSADGTQTWHFASYEPEEKPDRDAQSRYRQVTLPEAFGGWYRPEFDPAASDGWKSATAPLNRIPPGFSEIPRSYRALMDGAGEVLMLRKDFHLDDLDYELFRLSVISRQGFRVYLNGEPIHEDRGRSRNWSPREFFLDANARQHLREGRNTIAVLSFMQYFRGEEGAVDVYVEALRSFPDID